MVNEKRLIDVNQPINSFKRCAKDHPNSVWNAFGIEEVLNACPTVDAVEVVHGQWLDGHAVDHTGKKVYDSIDCSVCEEIFKIESHDREYWKGRFKVCPFCGAVMDGGNEDA